MKTISIQRPWPEAIFREKKTIECRNWQVKYRGIIAIHVSLKKWCTHWDDSYYTVKGAIVGTVELVDIITFYGPNSFHLLTDKHLLPMGNWTKYGWVFENLVRFSTPIPYRGKLGLWESPTHADLCRHARAFEAGVLEDTHSCGKNCDPCLSWQENMDKVLMINANEGDCDDCERWEAI